MNQTLYKIAILVLASCFISSSVVAYSFVSGLQGQIEGQNASLVSLRNQVVTLENHIVNPSHLDVHLSSSKNELVLGQSCELMVMSNGSVPFTYSWLFERWNIDGLLSNETRTGNQPETTYALTESCLYVNAYVTATDSNGVEGRANLRILDPAIATTNYFLDTPLPIADFYMGQYSNASYFAINGTNWRNFLVNTNGSYVINTCAGNGTRVYVGCSITLNAPIIPTQNYTDIDLHGNLTLANGANCDIIHWDGSKGIIYGVHIHGATNNIFLDGNATGQSALSRGIYINASAEIPNLFVTNDIGYPSAWLFEDLTVENCRNESIRIDSANSQLSHCGFLHVNAWNSGDGEQVVYLRQVIDSFWIGGLIAGFAGQYGVNLESCTAFDFAPDYLNGCHLLIGCSIIDFHPGNIIDNTQAGDTITLAGVYDSTFHDLRMRKINNANTYDAFKMTQGWSYFNCTHNSFSDIDFITGGVTFKYGIEEDSNSANNTYSALNGASTCQTALLRNLGTGDNITCTLGMVAYT